MFCHQSPTRACVTGNGEAPSLWDNVAVRHEVAIITVEPASAGLHPLFHQRFPTLRHEVAFIAVMPVPQDIT